MKDCLSFIFSSEIRFCSLLIGLIECAWSMIGMIPTNESLFASTLIAAGLEVEWFASMLCIGLLMIAGSIFPWRAGRHIGLFLSSIMWFTMFGVFLDANIFTPVVSTMPIFGVFSIALIYADAQRKPREKLAD